VTEEHEDVYDDHAIVCPYCGLKHHEPYEMVSPDGDCHEIECEDCGRKFNVTATMSVTYHSVADCELNDEAHNLEEKMGTKGMIQGSKFCTKCGRCILNKTTPDTKEGGSEG
jgi:DNA-directed RNA polymerase subunit RPC12/RpoP